MLPSWPSVPPAHGTVVLRAFDDADVAAAVELGEDPYVPLIGTLPARPTTDQALAWIDRQRGRLAEGAGFSFAIADARTGQAVGFIGLWLRNLSTGRASAGYAVSPSHRGRGVATDALTALTTFAWTIPAVDRIELEIEPWNVGSVGVAEAVGYRCADLRTGHREIGGTRREMLIYVATRPPGEPA